MGAWTMRRQAFTLVEMLTVIAIITVVAAILLPALVKARSTARKAQCVSNLRQLGYGLQVFADRDAQGRFCTGAFDFQRDGCPDTWGWVADLVKVGICRPGDLLDPSNPATASGQFQAMLSDDTTLGVLDGGILSRLGDGACGIGATAPGAGGTTWGNLFNNTAKDSVERSDYLARSFLDKGLNTNYAASWYLVRSGIRLSTGAGADTWVFRGPSLGNSRGVGATIGPLTKRMLDGATVPSSMIPLLGDAGPASGTSALMTAPGIKSISPNKTYVDSSVVLAASFNPGPAYYDSSGPAINLLSVAADTDLTAQVRCERAGGGCAPPDNSANHGWIQDVRAWAPLHSGVCNMLMADGSVKSLVDQNADGYLNPGFPLGAEANASLGYKPGEAEMPSTEVYGGMFLEKVKAIVAF